MSARKLFSPHKSKVQEYLQVHPLTKIGSAAKDLKLSIPTVTSALETLTKLKIAKESTGKRRDRLFAYGVTSDREVTTAQSAALSDELTAVNILGRRMVDAVTLVQALGGGWDRSSLPDRPDAAAN
jgi:outer membrane protein TolC